MIPNYKQSCTQLLLNWEEDQYDSPTVQGYKHCPFCKTDLAYDATFCIISCVYCSYHLEFAYYYPPLSLNSPLFSFEARQPMPGIMRLFYQDRKITYERRNDQHTFNCGKLMSPAIYCWERSTPIISLQTMLNKINSLILARKI